MEDQIRKAFLIGLGVTLLTKERIEEEIRTFMHEHNLTEEESRKMVEEIVKRGMKHKNDIEKRILKAEKELVKGVKSGAKEFVKRPKRPKARKSARTKKRKK